MSGKQPGKDAFLIQNDFSLRNMSKLKRKTVFLGSWSRLFLDTSVSGCLSLPTASFSPPVTLPGHLREAQLPVAVHVEHPQLPGHKQQPVTRCLLLPSLPPTVGWRKPQGGTALPRESRHPPGPARRSHLRWSACTPAAWARRRAGSPSSAGPTRSPGRRGLCWLSPSPAVPAGTPRQQGPVPARPAPAAHLELVGFDVAAAVRVVLPPSLRSGRRQR